MATEQEKELVRERTNIVDLVSSYTRLKKAGSFKHKGICPFHQEKDASFTVDDLVARARGGDGNAVDALQATARYLGLGLASVVNAADPARIFLSGEIIAAWDLIEQTVRGALAERVLVPAASSIEITPVPTPDHPRLRGAAALVTAPLFAAPKVG